MKLKVLYSNEPYKKTYNLFYGLPPFRVPYKFLYADGVGAGNYQFLYDSRDELYNQEIKVPLTFRDRRIEKAKLIQKFAFIEQEILRENLLNTFSFIEKEALKEKLGQTFSFIEREISLNNLLNTFSFIEKEALKEKLGQTFSFIEREIYRDKTKGLERRSEKDREIKLNSFYLLSRNLQEIISQGEFLLQILRDKDIFRSDTKTVESIKSRNINTESFYRVLESIKKDLCMLKEKIILENKEKEISKYKILNLSRFQEKKLNISKSNIFTIRKTKSINIQKLKALEFNGSRDIEKAYIIDLTGEREKNFHALSNSIGICDKVERELDVLEAYFQKLYTLSKENEILTDDVKSLNKNIPQDNLIIFKMEILATRRILKNIKIENLINNFTRKVFKNVLVEDSTKQYIRKLLKEIFNNHKTIKLKRKIYELDRDKEHYYLERNKEKDTRANKTLILERIKIKETKINKSLILNRNKEKDTYIGYLLKFFVRDSKDLFIEAIEAELTRAIVKEVLKEVLEIQLSKNSNKEIKKIDPSKFLNKQRVIEVFREIIGKYFDKEAVKPIKMIDIRQFGDKKPIEKKLIISSILAQVEKEVLRSILSEKNIAEVEKKVTRAIESIFGNIELEKIQKAEVEILFSKILDPKQEREISVLEVERDLKLYKRLWFLKEMKPYDLLILPQDYPYNTEPVEFSTEEMTPENQGVVYPNEFYKRIDVHPIPWGEDFEPEEIPVAINILVEMVNIFMLLWAKFHKPFWGWTGTQAVLGITESVYEWFTLETSQEEMDRLGVKRHYERAFKWLRWEAEKMALKARNDMGLKGNYYVGLLLEELIYYLKDHHVDIMPIFEDVQKMDEWRHIYKGRPLENDVKFILEKTKGLRHKIEIGREIKENG